MVMNFRQRKNTNLTAGLKIFKPKKKFEPQELHNFVIINFHYEKKMILGQNDFKLL